MIWEQESVSKKTDWLTNFKGCYEYQEQGFDKGFSGIAQSIMYALLVLCVLGTVYACFEKIEPEPSFLPAAEIEGLDVQNDLS